MQTTGNTRELWWVLLDGKETVAEVVFKDGAAAEVDFIGSDMTFFLDGQWGDDPGRVVLLEKVKSRYQGGPND